MPSDSQAARPTPPQTSTLVWDLPLRLFHWSLAGLVAAAVVTANVGGNAMVWHGRIGVAIAGLLAFRVAWGLVGSTHARFAAFVGGPAAIRAYLAGAWRGAGHNPLGALSVLAMLGALAFQAGSGLFGNDDIAFTGPLYALVSKDMSDALTGLHHKGAWLVGALVALHLAAIVYYRLARGEDLVRPMLTGRKTGDHAPARGGGILALAFALAVGCGVAWVAAGGLFPAPAAKAPAMVDPGW